MPADRISASGRISASAHHVFMIVSDPAGHVAIDAIGNASGGPRRRAADNGG